MKLSNLFIATCAAACINAQAATVDGPLDTANSTGTVDVTLTVDTWVRVSNLDAIALVYAGADLSVDETFCIYYNGPNDVDVELSLLNDNSGGTTPVMVGANPANELDYAITYDDLTPGGPAVVALRDSVAGSVFRNGEAVFNATSTTCVGGDTHKLTVDVLAADIDVAPADSYADEVTITVTPN